MKDYLVLASLAEMSSSTLNKFVDLLPLAVFLVVFLFVLKKFAGNTAYMNRASQHMAAAEKHMAAAEKNMAAAEKYMAAADIKTDRMIELLEEIKKK